MATEGNLEAPTNGTRSPGKVAIFATCYVNYNEPGIGHDLIKTLEHNEIPYVIVEKESCCGMPKLELGDLDGVAKHKEANIPVLAKYAKDGFAILSAIPSCTLTFKQELPLLFPDDADVVRVHKAMLDPFEYLMARHKDGLLKTDFKQALGKVSYHIPCHGRVQKIGKPVFKAMSKDEPDYISSDCALAGHHIAQGMAQSALPAARLAHPLSLVRIAYGLE